MLPWQPPVSDLSDGGHNTSGDAALTVRRPQSSKRLKAEVVVKSWRDIKQQLRTEAAAEDSKLQVPDTGDLAHLPVDKFTQQAHNSKEKREISALDLGKIHTNSKVKAEPLPVDVEWLVADVEVPAKVKEELTEQEIRDTITSYANPKAKIKRNVQLSYDFVRQRIQHVGFERYPMDLDEDTLHKTFSRYYISNLYGGSPVNTFPTIQADRLALHGLENWACLSLDYNPHAPVNPGDPGLFFEGERADGTWDGVHRTLVCLSQSNWLYVGEYTFSAAESLTTEEYVLQDQKVKRTWAENIRMKTWGTEVLTTVHLRNVLQREPNEEEIRAALSGNPEELRNMRNSVTNEHIIAAYASGEEELGVWCMKCVGYDEEWQKFLTYHYPDYLDYERAKKIKREEERKGKKGKKQDFSRGEGHDSEQRTRKSAKASHKQKHVDSDVGELELSDESRDIVEAPVRNVYHEISGDEGEDDEEVPQYKPRGTRSRPILVE